MGQFKPNSLLYLSGCTIAGTDFWTKGLATKGVGALVSWDGNAFVQDEYFTAAAFFHFLGLGQTATAALASTRSAGYGTSAYAGTTATLRVDGNGLITLQSAAVGGPPGNPTPTNTPIPPPPASTATSTRVPAATSTPKTAPPAATSTPVPPTATPTPTTVPPRLSLALRVKPGEKQQISASGFPANASVQFVVTFPNGDLLGQKDSADAAGTAQFAFSQPASKITRESNIATVSVQAQGSTLLRELSPASATSRYAIGFGKIDVSVEPREANPGDAVAVYVHTRKHTHIAVTIRTSSLKTLAGNTGSKGWKRLTYRIPRGLKSGRTLMVRAWVTLHGHLTQAKSPLKVR
jgi:hypothetical protein